MKDGIYNVNGDIIIHWSYGGLSFIDNGGEIEIKKNTIHIINNPRYGVGKKPEISFEKYDTISGIKNLRLKSKNMRNNNKKDIENKIRENIIELNSRLTHLKTEKNNEHIKLTFKIEATEEAIFILKDLLD